MEPLKTTHRCLIWLCMCPAEETASRWQKFAYNTFGTIVLVAIISGFVANVVFCVRFISIDLERSMFAVMFVAAQFGVIYMALVAIFFKRQKINTIFKNLTIIYRDGKQRLENELKTLKKLFSSLISFTL